MLGSGVAMLQTPVLDGLSFDPFPFQQDGLAAPEVDIGGREVIQALVVVPTENLIRTVRVTDRADVGPANDGNVSIAAVHSVNVDEWLASFGRSSGRRAAACTVFRRRPSMAVVRPRDDGSCGAGRPRAASP